MGGAYDNETDNDTTADVVEAHEEDVEIEDEEQEENVHKSEVEEQEEVVVAVEADVEEPQPDGKVYEKVVERAVVEEDGEQTDGNVEAEKGVVEA